MFQDEKKQALDSPIIWRNESEEFQQKPLAES
jgi:hypothetical protein